MTIITFTVFAIVFVLLLSMFFYGINIYKMKKFINNVDAESAGKISARLQILGLISKCCCLLILIYFSVNYFINH